MDKSLAFRMQNIDRRILYIVLLAIVVIGLIFPIPLPLAISPQAQKFFDAVEKAPTNKAAIVSVVWSASTQGENRPQTEVFIRHLMSRRIRILIMAFGGDAQSVTLAQEITGDLAKEYNYEYGKDWISLGYRLDQTGTLKGALLDIVQVYKTDSKERRPLGEWPVMAGVKSLKDIGVVGEISASGAYKNWIGLVGSAMSAPLCYGPTSVMAPELYTYLDSGQIAGMMFGIKGAAEYEALLVKSGVLKKAGFTTRAITPISLALVLLFVLIGLGNWGMYAARKAEAKG